MTAEKEASESKWQATVSEIFLLNLVGSSGIVEGSRGVRVWSMHEGKNLKGLARERGKKH